MQRPHLLLILCTALAPFTAQAATSANYSLEPATLDNGGLATRSTHYRARASASAGGAMSSQQYSDRAGFAGQLADVAAMPIVITAPFLTVNEDGTCQLGATLAYDDQTTLVLPVESITWNVLSGPISAISNTGLITGGAVYQDSLALVRGTYLTFSATLEVTVLNTADDNFAAYTHDGISDSWQVQNFGLPPNAMAAALADPDGDGLNNLQEYAFGMNPTKGIISSVTWNGSEQVGAGMPVQFATHNNGTFAFQAVYARRIDHASAHLRYTVEFSEDLLTWKTSTATPSVLADDGRMQVISEPYPSSVAGKNASYFRVKVETQ